MEIRAMNVGDLDRIGDIDAVVESAEYLHLHREGEGLAVSWRIEQRPLREKLIEANPVDDDLRLALKQIVGGMDEGLAVVAEHEGTIVAAMLAQPQPNGTLKLLDLRVDWEYRRQGIGSALLYRAIQEARERGLRAVMAQTRTNNFPAGPFLLKAGFDLSGLDAQMLSNHDLVKEAVTLFWYVALD